MPSPMKLLPQYIKVFVILFAGLLTYGALALSTSEDPICDKYELTSPPPSRLPFSVIRQSAVGLVGQSPSSRKLLCSVDDDNKYDKFLLAWSDGTISLMDGQSRVPLWTLATGFPLLYSKRADPNVDHFIDFGDNGQLYEYSNAFGRRELNLTFEELVHEPAIIEDSRFTFGSKVTTLYFLNETNGEVLARHQLPGTQTKLGVPLVEEKLVASRRGAVGGYYFVEKTEYNLRSIALPIDPTQISPDVEEPLWKLSRSHIRAIYIKKGKHSNMVDKLELPSCQIDIPVYFLSLASKTRVIAEDLRLPPALFPYYDNHNQGSLMLPISPNTAKNNAGTFQPSSGSPKIHELPGKHLPSNALALPSQSDEKISDHNVSNISSNFHNNTNWCFHGNAYATGKQFRVIIVILCLVFILALRLHKSRIAVKYGENFCIASAACKSDDTHNINGNHNTISCFSEGGHVKSIKKVVSSRATDLLDVLGVIIERSKQHFNPNYRLKVCEQIVKVAASVINICEVSLEVLLHFLSTVPREFTDCAGQVRAMVQQWLTQNNKISSIGSFDTNDVLLESLVSYAVSFLTCDPSCKDSMSFDDQDVDAWKLEAQRWARVFFLVIKETSCLEPILKVIQNHYSCICKHDYKIDSVSLKIIVLILSLVEELQIESRKFVIYDEAKVGRESRETQKLDRSSSLVTPSDCEELVSAFLLIMEEIASFSTLVSPIFWSGFQIVDSQVPCSIKGKLGGPSLRRLAPQTTAYLLQAIMSIRTLACISSWFSLLNRNAILYSSFTFSWDLSWKVIQSRTYKSEIGAELCLGGYEALAYVFKAWSTSFNMSAFDFVLSYNKSHCSDGDSLPLLDPLVLSFLHNINDLLANGVLTRSRRAVLLNWKWHCLGSLLSIPYNVVQNKVYRWSPHTFFSDSTVRSIFSDIVESLENAGENSVLNILRSVRFVIGLLCPASTTSVISSFTGVNCQMMYQLTHSSWILHLSCNKRRVAHIAALLSAVLHHAVFSDLRMHETRGTQPGPLKWFIAKLLDEGVKSPRTIRLAALHLTGLWLLHPKTLKYYIHELKLLSLYGSVAFDEDFEAELYENHEARTEVSLLAQSPDSELTELFINTELYARVSVAVLFHRLANLPNKRGREETEDSLAALHVGKMFLLELLDSAVNDKDIAKELYKKYSAVHRRKVRAWQMICILSNFVANDIVIDVTAKLHICLYRNNLPAVRQYLETFAIQVYLKFPALAEEQLIPIFYDYNMRPQALSSYVFIATNVIIHASDSSVQMKHLNELLPPMIPFLTSHHHSLRAFTQLLVHYVLCKMWSALVPATSTVTPLEKKCFEDLKSYLAENVDCKRLRTSMEGFLDVFDPNTSVTPAGVFSARNEGSEFECAPISLMENVIVFLNDVRDGLRNSIAKDAVTIEKESLIVPGAYMNTVEVHDVDAEKGSDQTSNDACLDFQKKITLFENARPDVNAGFHSFLSEMENEDQLINPVIHSRIQAIAKIRESQQQFVLVASLVDRIPNLAGLARTCEIFKAAELAIPNASIVHDKQFQLISVTAEKWVPIREVPVNSMKIFLEKKRQEGFSILGLEQTANSTPLDKFSFPKKTVLVLGREKEGIPVDIIHILDACIEIPQLGIIRSLNVHVSGAIALWEYTRQQRLLRP